MYFLQEVDGSMTEARYETIRQDVASALGFQPPTRNGLRVIGLFLHHRAVVRTTHEIQPYSFSNMAGIPLLLPTSQALYPVRFREVSLFAKVFGLPGFHLSPGCPVMTPKGIINQSNRGW
jgi:hypothetical protein